MITLNKTGMSLQKAFHCAGLNTSKGVDGTEIRLPHDSVKLIKDYAH